MTSRWPDREPDDEPSEEDQLEGRWELDPNDPTHPDYDLSEAAGYASWEPAPKPILARRGVVLLLAVLIIMALMIPILARIT